MGCPITLLGIANDCKGIGGVSKLYLADFADIASVTADQGTGEVTITMQSGKKFTEYQTADQVANMVSTINSDEVAGTSFVTTEVTAAFRKMSAAKRIEITALSLGYVACIVKDKNGKYWYVGTDNPAYLTAGGGQTGQANGDANQYNITITHHAGTLPPEVDPTTVSSIVQGPIDQSGE